MPDLLGFSHIDLTVSDCEKSAVWWRDVLGFDLMTRSEGETFEVWSLRHPSGVVVSVMTHQGTRQEEFDERRVGLDHFSLQVSNREELEHWVEHLDGCGVTHSGIMDATWGPTLVFRDPDNIQLELFVHPTPEEVAERSRPQTNRERRAERISTDLRSRQQHTMPRPNDGRDHG